MAKKTKKVIDIRDQVAVMNFSQLIGVTDLLLKKKIITQKELIKAIQGRSKEIVGVIEKMEEKKNDKIPSYIG